MIKALADEPVAVWAGIGFVIGLGIQLFLPAPQDIKSVLIGAINAATTLQARSKVVPTEKLP